MLTNSLFTGYLIIMEASKRKEHILKCAKKLFSTKGFYKTHISDIIVEANIARGTFYQYFESKENIYITLLNDFYEKWLNYFSLDEQLNLKTITPRELFHYRINESISFLADDPEMSTIFLRVGHGLGGELESSIKKLEDKIGKIIIKDLELGVRNNKVTTEIDLEMITNIFLGAILQLSYHLFVVKGLKKESVDVEKISSDFLKIISDKIIFD